jgi:hypothetical protein
MSIWLNHFLLCLVRNAPWTFLFIDCLIFYVEPPAAPQSAEPYLPDSSSPSSRYQTLTLPAPTPSATSRKDVPAVFARKRALSTAFGNEDHYDLPPNPTEKDLKRRQNTVSARKSRRRKLERLQLLESSLEKERQEKEQWRERALMLASILTGLNQPVPDFSVDES